MNDKLNDDQIKKHLISKDKLNQTFDSGSTNNIEKSTPIKKFTTGYFKVNLEDLPSRGMYLPLGTTINIRAAKTKEIKHFSAMDENDGSDVQDRCNMVLVETIKISAPSKHMNIYDISEGDKIYLLLLCRDLTFKDSENKLYVDMKCNSSQMCQCKAQHQEELNSNILNRKELNDKILSFYSETDRCYVINSEKFGINDFRVYVPSIGVTTYILEFMKELGLKKRAGQNVKIPSTDFMNILPYIIKDWREFMSTSDISSVIAKYELDYASWSDKKFNIIHKFVELLDISVELEFKSKCLNGSEVTGTFSGFLNKHSFKDFFIVSNILDQLL